MTTAEYQKQRLEIIRELGRLENIGWGNDKTDETIFPYVIIEAINLLLNSQPEQKLVDFTPTGEAVQDMIKEAMAL